MEQLKKYWSSNKDTDPNLELFSTITLDKPHSGYYIFINEKYSEENKNKNKFLMKEVHRKYAPIWKKMTTSERDKYENLAIEERKKYKEDIELIEKYLIEDKIKHNVSGFHYYFNEKIKELKGSTNKKIPKNILCGIYDEWKTMSEEQKGEWNKKNDINKEDKVIINVEKTINTDQTKSDNKQIEGKKCSKVDKEIVEEIKEENKLNKDQLEKFEDDDEDSNSFVVDTQLNYYQNEPGERATGYNVFLYQKMFNEEDGLGYSLDGYKLIWNKLDKKIKNKYEKYAQKINGDDINIVEGYSNNNSKIVNININLNNTQLNNNQNIVNYRSIYNGNNTNITNNMYYSNLNNQINFPKNISNITINQLKSSQENYIFTNIPNVPQYSISYDSPKNFKNSSNSEETITNHNYDNICTEGNINSMNGKKKSSSNLKKESIEPKRPGTAYSLFIKDLARESDLAKNPLKSKKNDKIIWDKRFYAKASKLWQTEVPKEQKEKYEKMAHINRLIYKYKMGIFKKTKCVDKSKMHKGINGYTYFVSLHKKDKNFPENLTFAEYIKDEWSKLSTSEKNEYKRKAILINEEKSKLKGGEDNLEIEENSENDIIRNEDINQKCGDDKNKIYAFPKKPKTCYQIFLGRKTKRFVKMKNEKDNKNGINETKLENCNTNNEIKNDIIDMPKLFTEIAKMWKQLKPEKREIYYNEQKRRQKIFSKQKEDYESKGFYYIDSLADEFENADLSNNSDECSSNNDFIKLDGDKSQNLNIKLENANDFKINDDIMSNNKINVVENVLKKKRGRKSKKKKPGRKKKNI